MSHYGKTLVLISQIMATIMLFGNTEIYIKFITSQINKRTLFRTFFEKTLVKGISKRENSEDADK